MATNRIDLTPKTIPTRIKPKPRKSGKSRWLMTVLIAIGLISGSLGASLALVMSSRPLQQSKLSPEQEAQNSSMTSATAGLPALTRPVNILVLGTILLTSDLPEAAQKTKTKYLEQVDGNLNGMSDAMLMMRFDPTTKKLTVLSIPRDSRVHIPGVGETKINAANYLGGAALSAQTVSQMLGDVPIDRYIRVNVDGFGKLIDALGGVDIYVPKRMKYQDDSQHLYINLKPGQQRLDGAKAVQYMRYRYDDLGDIGRVQRQQTFFRAFVEQKLNVETIAKLPEVLSVLKENIDTNLSVEEVLALAAFVSKTNRKDARMLMVPGRFSNPGEYNLSYWIVDYKHLSRLMVDHFNVTAKSQDLDEDSHSPKYIRVAIQDSIKKPEGVKSATNVLSKAGYGQVFPADTSWAKPLAKTQIVAQKGDRTTAEQVRATLGMGEIVVESTGSIESDVTVRLGRDWLAAQPAVMLSNAQPSTFFKMLIKPQLS
ncbi:LCP family protein [Tumidithrix helvetica PCC 7403]|uniref:LCP family protein n=1 Tax=Tumidithrix helvetica TaxID=3457545 RepID=UPI003C857B2D